MAEKSVKSILIEAEKGIKTAKNLKELNAVLNKGNLEIGRIFKSLKSLSKEKKAKLGKEAAEAKRFLEEKVKEKKSSFVESSGSEEWIDITAPGKKPLKGHLHPITKTMRELEDIFQSMGFAVAVGPEIETEWYNFDALNFPPDHPAREMQDTFWIKQKNKENLKPTENLLMRTHTSNVQIHYMKKNEPPFRVIVPGRIFRHEATDASHETNFYQLEGLMVDKDISVANFKAVIKEFFKRFFKKPVEIRIRPSYFPFTEPSFEIDISCLVCGGKGCSTCSQTGWIELMGAGMVHPNVFKAAGVDAGKWQGFAFGMGIDRLVMMKYKINDVRLFYSGDLKFLEQF